MGHSYMGHNHTGHNYMGHNYMGHTITDTRTGLDAERSSVVRKKGIFGVMPTATTDGLIESEDGTGKVLVGQHGCLTFAIGMLRDVEKRCNEARQDHCETFHPQSTRAEQGPQRNERCGPQ